MLFDQIDLRLKVLCCLGLVILAFAAPGWLPLGIVALACGGLMLASGLPFGRIVRAWWSLRWLLLFTVLMHVLFSPGRTLFGSRWLSYDGLLHGLFVDAQLTIAILGAVLLSLSTPVEELAATIGWFLAPLKRLRCPVDAWQTQLQMVLRFVPQVRSAFLTRPDADPGKAGSFRPGRLQLLEARLTRTLDRLIEEADGLARRVAAGEETFTVPAWPAFRPFAGANGLILAGATVLVAGYLVFF